MKPIYRKKRQINMKESKTTYKGIQKAYDAKRMKYFEPDKYLRLKKYNENIENGICTKCGRKKLTDHQKKNKILNCFKCRQKMAQYKKNRKGVI